jgi:hypothetical protein
VRHERGEGQANENSLLSPTLSSIVPLEEREQDPFAINEEFYPAPFWIRFEIVILRKSAYN